MSELEAGSLARSGDAQPPRPATATAANIFKKRATRLPGMVMLAGPILLGSHVVTLYVWIIVRQWEAAEGHAGYDFHWSPTRLIPFSDGATHHDFHHAKVIGNYAGFFPWWDAAFGTLSKGYAEHLSARRRARWPLDAVPPVGTRPSRSCGWRAG